MKTAIYRSHPIEILLIDADIQQVIYNECLVYGILVGASPLREW